MVLNGYRASHKNKWFLITKRILTPQQFILFEYYLDLMVFDKEHKDLFGKFQAYPEEVANVFNKTVESINEWNNGLIAKGFISLVNKKRCIYTVKSPLRYVVGLDQWRGEASIYAKAEKKKPEEFILGNMVFFLQKEENIQPKSSKNGDTTINTTENSLISSNNGLVSSSYSVRVVDLKLKIRTSEEYNKIYEESGFKGLSPDDMRIADEVTHEEVVIESEKQEQEIIQEWFSGNKTEFEKTCRMVSIEAIEHL